MEILHPLYTNFDAIRFLKSEFKEDYNKFYEKYSKIRSKYNIMAFYHYKEYAIVNLFHIYKYEEYINFLNYNKLKISNIII